MLQTSERLIRAGNSEDLPVIQKMAFAFAKQENVSVDAIYPSDQSFVAEIDGTVIGAIVAHKHDATHWEIKLLYISGGHRLSGTGRALLKALENFVGPDIEIKVKATIGTQTYFQHLGWKPIDFLVWGLTT
jgi:N-acetylglutamate synthase-like GNAT family acetyltransferase